jgi:UDP-N-acetylmuramoyl-L-alanyl-D-glutamate--2,6-diaminopimelate ligase
VARQLREVLAGVAGEPFGVWDGVLVTDVAVDSRRVTAGSLYAAVAGRGQDGTGYVADALRRGAGSLLLPRGASPPPGVPGLWVTDPRRAAAEAASALEGHPAEGMWIAGVTGTNGKTTTALWAAAALRPRGEPVPRWTTAEVAVGARRFRPALTTPEPPDLHRFLRQAREAGETRAVLEVSSHAVALGRTHGVPFAAGAVTNVSADHLDFHGTVEAYRAAKRAFAESLPPEGVVVFDADDPGAREAVAGARARRVAYGTGPGADLALEVEAVGGGETRGWVRPSPRLRDLGLPAPAGGRLPLRVPLPGVHNLRNALAALGLALAAGVPLEEALVALGRAAPPPRRLAVFRLGPALVVDDVAMNEAGVDATLAAVAELAEPPVAVVVALRGHRGPEANAALARALARGARRLGCGPVFATLSRTAALRYGPGHAVLPEEAAAFARAAREAGLEVRWHEELEDAVAEAADGVRAGGTLVLLGTFGMDDGLRCAARALGAAEPPPYPLPGL